jgi:signal transduction histidine kinase
MHSTLNILIADDDDGDRKQIKRALAQTAMLWKCTETTSIQEALEACEKCAFDCAVVDYRLPGQDGLAGVTSLHERLPYMAIIMSTGQGDETVAAEAMRRGALDYLPKTQMNAPSIKRSVELAVERAGLQRQVDRQREELMNFTRVLVHDLKAPIQSVQGYAQLIEEAVQAGELEGVPQHCRRVVRSVERLTALIDTLHQHTLLDEPVAPEPVDLNQVVEDVLCNLSLLIRDRGACVTNDPLPVVSGNGPQLMQLLQNLIGNGIKYCKAEKPSAHVSVSRRDANSWLFSVQDNGIGIPEVDCQSIFEPFRRLHDVGKYAGTGLGLATCRKIVERTGGTIWCDSVIGLGSRFFFTLPALPSTDSNFEPASIGVARSYRLDA